MTKSQLAIDTCFKGCSVALHHQGEYHLLKSQEENMQFTNIPIMIDEIFKKTNCSFDDLNDIIVSKGPGSFTGVRIGLSFIAGIEVAYPDVNYYYLNSLDIYKIGQCDFILQHAIGDNYYIQDTKKLPFETQFIDIKSDDMEQILQNKTISGVTISGFIKQKHLKHLPESSKVIHNSQANAKELLLYFNSISGDSDLIEHYKDKEPFYLRGHGAKAQKKKIVNVDLGF